MIALTRSRARLDSILNAAAKLARNPTRTVFIGTFLPDYLATSDAASRSCFVDHRRRAVSLLPHLPAPASTGDYTSLLTTITSGNSASP